MIHIAKKLYKRALASFLLLTIESLLALTLFIISVIGFLLITDYIFVNNNHSLDDHAFQFMQTLVTPANNRLMEGLSFLGDYKFLITANLLLTGYFLFVKRHRWYSIKVPSIALSSVLMMLLLKQLFNRHRPLSPLIDPARGLSFPSGHAMSSVTFYGLLIFFIWNANLSKSLRTILISFLVILIVSIGLSRIYLRVHFATDVIAGFCMGTIWLILSIRVIKKIEQYSKNRISAKELS